MSGADRQIDGGNYTRVHNDILEALARTPLNGSEFRCLMALFRLTYGWRKKEDKISYGMVAKMADMQRQNAQRAMQRLLERKIIYCKSNGPGRTATWGINKYIEQWDSDVLQVDNTTVLEPDDTTVLEPDDSPNQPVLESDDTTVLRVDNTTVLEPDAHQRKERKERNLPTAGWRVPDFSDKVGDFVQAYQDIWGVMIHGEYIRDSIIEWADRVTLAGWEYALKQCVRRGKRQQWGYLEGILRRIESEGFEEQTPLQESGQESGTLDFSLDEVLI